MSLTRQVEEIGPSAAGALFRRLMIEDDLAYLRDHRTIIGFEVDMENNDDLAGYTVIALQKHTILAYRSDIHADKRLVLFPTLTRMQDPAFDLMRLNVQRKIFKDETFEAPVEQSGTLKEVAEDLMPSYQDRKISVDTVNQLSILEKPDEASDKPRAKVLEPPIVDDTDTVMDTPPEEPEPVPVPLDEPSEADIPINTYDADYDNFDYGYNAYDDPIDELPVESESLAVESPNVESSTSSTPSVQATEERGRQLLASQPDFNSLADVSDYVILNLNVGRDIATNVVNLALNSTRDATTQIEVAVLLFVRMFNENKI